VRAKEKHRGDTRLRTRRQGGGPGEVRTRRSILRPSPYTLLEKTQSTMLSFPGLPQSNTHQIPAVAQQQPKYEAPITREAVVPLWSWRLQAVFGRYVGGIIQQHSPGKYKYVLKVQEAVCGKVAIVSVVIPRNKSCPAPSIV